MGNPIPYDVRVKIVRDSRSGQSHQCIADAVGYSKEGVKKILRQYREQGESALKPDYSPCGKKPRKHFPTEIEEEIARRRLGLAGGPFVHSVLRELHPEQRVPSVSAIQLRWKQGGGRPQLPAKRERQPANTWTREVHHTWQIDGKEQIVLGSGTQVSWGNIADEASSTALHTGVFPPQNDDSGARNGHVPGGQPLF